MTGTAFTGHAVAIVGAFTAVGVAFTAVVVNIGGATGLVLPSLAMR